ncbi:hypothetical protein UlMin_011837 [Ulmus minor]
MGSSGEASDKGIDASVGGLVWVRRRNGSWWPGRIMGLDELSESCLVSPRSGTPVKLLGREDASVDWYNLEKSKRVKAFRCGEYDDCIEKAKASAANNKKAVKYARREDAILHALEIENARLGKGDVDFSTKLDNSDGERVSSARESPSISRSGNENEDNASDSEDNSDSAQELSQSGISFEEPNQISSSKVQPMQVRRRTPNDSEDDGTEGVKRMKGLEDLGVGVGSKRKVQAGVLLELVQQDNASLSESCNGNCVTNGNTLNGSRVNSSTKRKRSQVANVHDFLKRKNRRRPLTKVLESTAMVSVPVICDQLPDSCGLPLQGLSNGKVSGLESNESKKNLSVVTNNNSDCAGGSCEKGKASFDASEPACDTPNNKIKENEISSVPELAENGSEDRLFDVPFVGEEKHSAGVSPLFVPNGSLGRQSSLNSQEDAVPLRIEGINENGSASSAAVLANIDQSMEKGTSKWQLKGKRNSRKVSKNRNQDLRNMDDESNAYVAGLENSGGFSQGFNQKADCNGISGSSGSYTSALQAKFKPDAEEQGGGFHNMIEPTTEEKFLPDGSLAPQRLLPYRQSRFSVHSRYRTSDLPIKNPSTNDTSLYDVKLEVQANSRTSHVPLVSLMSKLNGKAIVGHPLTVEVLQDGQYEALLGRMERNLLGGRTDYPKLNSAIRRIPAKQFLLQSRRSLNKSSKTKKSGLLTKKIRKLSSLTGHKNSEERKPVVEKPKGPLIACIPLKLVFSRINEAVNGSARQIHRALASSKEVGS